MELNKFYNCDCMEYMKTVPDKYFELAIVDPPYGIGDFRNNSAKIIHKKIEWNNEIPQLQYFEELKRISINRIIFGVNYYTEYVHDTGRIIHDKTGGGKRNNPKEMSNVDLASHDYNNTMKIFHYMWLGNVQGDRINWNNEDKIHPCQKPIELYKWILKNYPKKGDKIFDSHVGSGSSLIACIEEGFEYVGCELDKEYYETACKRIEMYKNRLKRKIWKN